MDKYNPLLELKTVANALYSEANKILTDVGLTLNQADILRYVMINGRTGEITQKNLQDAFKVKHSTMSGTIGRLEEKGFLQTYQKPNDKRNIIVKATDKSLNLIETLKSTSEIANKFFKGLSEDEIEVFLRTLHKIYANI